MKLGLLPLHKIVCGTERYVLEGISITVEWILLNFIDKNKDKLSNNHRMAMILKTYGRMKEDNINAMKEDAAAFLTKITKNEEV